MNDLGILNGVKNPLATVAQDSGEQAIAQMNVPGSDDWFGQINQDAVDYSKERSADLVSNIEDSTRNKLRTIISDGIEAGESRDLILDSIAATGLFSDKRAELIADTEIRMANGQGRLSGYKAARAHGVKLKKFWVLGANSCDECIENADAGPIDLDDDFPGTETDMDPGHPNCDCGTSTEMESDDDNDEEDDSEADQGADEEPSKDNE